MKANKRTKAAEKGSNKERILAVAEQLFSEKGVNNTSLADVAKRAGISKGTLYYHFSSKNDLVFAITESQMKILTKELFELVDNTTSNASFPEAINLVLTTLIDAQDRGRLHHYLIHEALTGNEVLRQQFLDKYEEWRQLLIAKMAQREPKSIDHPYLADTIIAVIDGFILQSLLGKKDIPSREAARQLCRL